MLPNVWTEPFNREIINELKLEAAKRFRRFQLPQSAEEWKKKRCRLLDALKRKLNIQVDHRLELDCRWSSPLRFDGYTLKEVCYQSRKDFYVTASLYVPDGKGPFPGIVGMHGHLSDGRLAEKSQGIAIRLAKSGYAVLFVDAFGSGERAAVHGEFEYHGGMVGGNLLNIGEPLLGIQVIDNMRAVDLLCSLPFVDGERIGATGSSGGGNQTMYLAAFDERVKAAVPVVSVGSYQSYVGGTNCICELIPDGLTICEESSLLALAAPNALMICNALHDINHTFHVSEAARSYTEAQKVYTALGVPEKISALAFNAPHAYPPELQGAVIGFFDFFLKGKGHGLRVVPPAAEVIPREKVMFFRKGRRSAEVCSQDAAQNSRRAQKELFPDLRRFCASKRKRSVTLFIFPRKTAGRNIQSKPHGAGFCRFCSEKGREDPAGFLPRRKGKANWRKRESSGRRKNPMIRFWFSIRGDAGNAVIFRRYRISGSNSISSAAPCCGSDAA